MQVARLRATSATSAYSASSWEGFDGFDWDLEGNDDGKGHGNVFSTETMELVGQLSVAAKRDG